MPVAEGPYSHEDQVCDGQICTETMQVHDAGEKFHDGDLSFDRNSIDDRLATVSHATVEKLDHMHRNFGGNVDDMFGNIFSNDLTDENLALVFEYTVTPEVYATDRLRELRRCPTGM